MMDKMYRILGNSCLIISVLLLKLSNVHCCLPEPENAVRFVFEALPSVNVSLGDKLELKCTANNASNLKNIGLLSRNHKQLKATCSVSSDGGICSYLIMKVQPWDIGKYDCIKIYKDESCYSKSLLIQKAVIEPTQITSATTMKPAQRTTLDTTREVTKDPMSPRRFVFEALPSVNVSLGDKLELKCTANNTSNIKNMDLLSRNHKQLKATCNVSSDGGICSYLIMKVQPWDIGKYDCIKIHKDGSCNNKSLLIQKAVIEPTQITSATTMKPAQRTTSDTTKEVTKYPALNITIFVSENPTPGGGATSITSHMLKLVNLVLFAAVATFN